ncbi:MAG: hypothetical protein JXJ04_09870 [Spirochaetales bacterium]|nr:hypothetical protein [Spirochaetales bacterium]
MKRKKLFFMIPLMVLAISVYTQNRPPDPDKSFSELNNVFDFFLDMGEIFEYLNNPGDHELVLSKFIILNGSISSITINNRAREEYEVVIELLKGKWIDISTIEKYICKVNFFGPGYYNVFPVRPPRTPDPGVIELNSDVKILAWFAGIEESPDGMKIPVFMGYNVKKTE